MDIDWMTDRFDLCEAIPPAYSEYIGRAFLSGQDLDVSPGLRGPDKNDLEKCSYVDGYGPCSHAVAYLAHADGGAGWGWRHIDSDFDDIANHVGYPMERDPA